MYRTLKKKVLSDPDKHDSMITCLEPDRLECEFEWTLGNISRNKTRRSGGIAANLFQLLNTLL